MCTVGTQFCTDIVSGSMRLTFPTAVGFVEIPYCVIGFESSLSGYANV